VTRCPQCHKPLSPLPRQCPTCRADLDLLVDYVEQLHRHLAQAEQCTRQGELGQAVWAYLAVLEVDPDNAVARRQVEQIAAAVRHFDRSAPGRRWLAQQRAAEERRAFWSRWRQRLQPAALFALLLAAFLLGFLAGELATAAGWTWTGTPPRPTLSGE
jgi:hypothetical protein